MNTKSLENIIPMRRIEFGEELAEKIGFTEARFCYGDIFYSEELKIILINCLVVEPPESVNFKELIQGIERAGLRMEAIEDYWKTSPSDREVLYSLGYERKPDFVNYGCEKTTVIQWQKKYKVELKDRDGEHGMGRAGAQKPMQSDEKGC